MPQIKVHAVTFDHSAGFTGEVKITRGQASISVPWDALVRLVAEKVRADSIAALEKAKPADLVGPVF